MEDALTTESIALGFAPVYPFDEASGNLIDATGGTNATVSGSPIYQADDQNGEPGAILFDGLTDYFTSLSNLLSGAPAYSVLMLLNPSQVGTLSRPFDERDASNDGVQLLLAVAPSIIWQHNAVSATASTPPENGTWLNILATWTGNDTELPVEDRNLLRLYINATLEATEFVDTPLATTTPARIGGRAFSTFANAFGGSMSHVAVNPTTAIGQADVSSLFAASQPSNSTTMNRIKYGVGLGLGLGLG